MLEWRDELSKLNDDVLDKVADFWSKKAHGFIANENGRRKLSGWIKKFDLDLLLEAIETSAQQYVQFKDGKPTSQSVNYAFDMIPRVAGGKLRDADKPWLKDVYYIRAILRNRLSYVNERDAVLLMERAIECFVDIEWMRNLAKRVGSWSQFRDAIQDFVNDAEGDE